MLQSHSQKEEINGLYLSHSQQSGWQLSEEMCNPPILNPLSLHHWQRLDILVQLLSSKGLQSEFDGCLHLR